MGRFFYKAIKDKKEVINGYVEASDASEAKVKIRDMGFLLQPLGDLFFRAFINIRCE